MAERESCVQSAITCVEGILLLLSLIALDRAMPWIGCPHSFGQSTYIEAVIGLCDVIGNSPNTFSASHYKKKTVSSLILSRKERNPRGRTTKCPFMIKVDSIATRKLNGKKRRRKRFVCPRFFSPLALWVMSFFFALKRRRNYSQEKKRKCVVHVQKWLRKGIDSRALMTSFR